ncbi:hypothetical protein [Stutzerimonas stutzeri]|uniref:hypothetical protein n=1 Tax=Stutzerimonas stutzeri TaxID=316 RepID=UPI00220DA16F|nr:hypothetical protein [Stutzerimonas stutzeri]UVO19544.1 hypothetical protein KN217_07535 [Stutzerimonas stutzeri]
MTDKTDAEFEAWWIKQPHRQQFEDVKDQMRNVAVAFYQKGREDVVIEIDEISMSQYASISSYRAAEAMRFSCIDAIEAAGAKWRE